MAHYLYLIIYIVFFTIVQYYYISYSNKNDSPNKKLDKRIAFNLANSDSIEKTISDGLKKRLDLLKKNGDKDPSKLNFDQWTKYNNDNPFIIYPENKDMKYWIQCWKSIPNTDNENFQLRVYPDKSYLYHTWKDLVEHNQKIFISNHVETDPQLIKKFFLLNEKPYSIFKFYWYDPVFDRVVERKSIVYTYDDGFGNKGTFSAGYTVDNINKLNTYNHFASDSGKWLYYTSLLSTILIASIIFYSNREYPKMALLKSIIFFSILMIYMTSYFTSYDEFGVFDIEKIKFDGINQGILSMSFMTGISIFILTSMKSKKSYLYKETSFLLIIVMFTIIATLVKDSSFLKPKDITLSRSIKEFIFNYCISVNLFIIINFGLNVFF